MKDCKKSKFIFIAILINMGGIISAQPFLDIVNVHGYIIPFNQSDSLKKREEQASLNFALPFKIDSSNSIVAFPGYEILSVGHEAGETKQTYNAYTLPITWVHTFKSNKVKLASTFIYRHQPAALLPLKASNAQAGGALLFTYISSQQLTLKAGVYYNHEFFGDYWLPLIGCEYIFNEHTRLWALLPRNVTLDFALLPCWHTGITLKGITESWRTTLNYSGYTKLSEGLVRIYSDWYVHGTPLTLNLASGFAVHRRYEYSMNSLLIKQSPADGLLFEGGISYRFITDKSFVIRQRL